MGALRSQDKLLRMFPKKWERKYAEVLSNHTAIQVPPMGSLHTHHLLQDIGSKVIIHLLQVIIHLLQAIAVQKLLTVPQMNTEHLKLKLSVIMEHPQPLLMGIREGIIK